MASSKSEASQSSLDETEVAFKTLGFGSRLGSPETVSEAERIELGEKGDKFMTELF